MNDGELQTDAPEDWAATQLDARPTPEPEPADRTRPGASQDPDHPSIVGHRIGHYHVVDRLGAGAMGTVYQAYDETLDRRVAIKLLHDRQSERQQKRLLREAQALARLSHPNVVQVYEIGETEGRRFIAMELVLGQSMDRWHDQPRPWRDRVDAYLQAGHGLAGAHAQGLIHRDFKPSNCVIDERGRVKVLDFGLARQSDASDPELDSTLGDDPSDPSDHPNPPDPTLGESMSPVGSQSNRALSEALTRTGALLGTPAYMAPEQLLGRGATALSDQFSFCVSLYEALYHQRPFAHASVGALINAVLGDELRPPPSRPRVPAGLWTILRRGLSREPDQRWPSMEALLQRLQRVRHRSSHRRWLGVVGLAALTTTGALWSQPSGAPPCREAPSRIAPVWSPARAQTVGDALLATGVPYAEGTRRRVLEALDGYAEAWARGHTAACEASRVHQAQSDRILDLRMHCLERRRTALDRAAQMLEISDTAMVEHAVAMVDALPDLGHCDDVVALQSGRPAPGDPADAQRVEDLRDELARHESLRQAHRLDDALAVVEPILERARDLGYGPLRAEALLARGTLLNDAGRYAEAEAALLAAHALALELGLEPVAADSAQQLTNTVGYRLSRHDAGRAWGLAAEALARRVDPGGSRHANALRATAIVQVYQGQLDGASERFEHALRIWESRGGAPGLGLARALGDLGNLRLAQGRIDEALRTYDRAATIKREQLGEGHPNLASSAVNIGRAHEARGDLPLAGDHYRRALELIEAAFGPQHPEVATPLNNLAVIHDKMGEPDVALPLYERVLAIREQALGPSHPYVGQTLVNIGMAFRAKSEHARALSYFERALERLEPHGGADVEHTLYELSQTKMDLGRLTDARDDRDRMLALARARHDDRDDSHEIAFAEFAVGQVQWIQGQRVHARARVERAHRRAEAAGVAGEALRRSIGTWLEEHPLP